MKHMNKIGITLTCLALLSGCGGGGGDGDGGESLPVGAQGFWTGSNGVGEDFLMAVLPSGETWFVSLRNDALDNVTLDYVIQGNATLNGRQFNINDAKRIALSPWSSSPGLLTGTLTSSTRLTVNLTPMDSDVSYNTPLTYAEVAGTYNAVGFSALGSSSNARVTITNQGQVSATNLGGNCTATGALSATGKNVMTLSMTFNGSSCALGNGTNTQGIVIYNAEDRLFLGFSLNAGRTDGFIAAGFRQ